MREEECRYQGTCKGKDEDGASLIKAKAAVNQHLSLKDFPFATCEYLTSLHLQLYKLFQIYSGVFVCTPFEAGHLTFNPLAWLVWVDEFQFHSISDGTGLVQEEKFLDC